MRIHYYRYFQFTPVYTLALLEYVISKQFVETNIKRVAEYVIPF